ncbi:MAG: 16S rRNA (guanine1516-N2)-methyltransferase [Candidatus Electronema aureum]|uniref:Ribosomal RNA small subunit methyltransferase J n=1 Tax=Candidatus Electronema aureum TaxID=2005002 RepID=A0A521G1S1_9BACT|nr:MAG: 16S rRNA (guanine1516-N2)-methyltransferase [Candidatus Electronema aureum]
MLIDTAVVYTDSAIAKQAETLAFQLKLPLAQPGQLHELLLRCTPDGLELLKPDDPHLSGPVRVDFTAGAAAFRRKQQGKELLLRAVGCKIGRPLAVAVIDATGGLGRDSFLLAAAGCTVQIFERQPILAALLADGLERARQCRETAQIAERIQLFVGDAVSALHKMQERGQHAAVIYLDPMFPERRKSALVKKEAQMLQLLASAEAADEAQLLAAALAVGKRVVVKRPVKATCIAGPAPSHAVIGKTVRFDVYLHTTSNLKKANAE